MIATLTPAPERTPEGRARPRTRTRISSSIDEYRCSLGSAMPRDTAARSHEGTLELGEGSEGSVRSR